MRYKITGSIIVLLAVVAVYISFTFAQAPSTKVEDPWARFRFLLGKWSGTGSGQPGEAVGSTSFSFDLNENILVKKNRVEFPPKPGEKSGLVHEDLTIIYREPGDSLFRAIYFDNESHVIKYIASFPAKPQSVILESEGSKQMPRFRLVHEMGADSLLTSEFFMAQPGGDFQSYIKGTDKRTN